MKRCPTCSRTYADSNMRFCQFCGTVLVTELTKRPDSSEVGNAGRPPRSDKNTPAMPSQQESINSHAPSPQYTRSATAPDDAQTSGGRIVLTVMAVLSVLAIVAFASVTVVRATKVLGELTTVSIDPSLPDPVIPSEDHSAEVSYTDPQPDYSQAEESIAAEEPTMTEQPATVPDVVIVKHFTICAEALTWEEANQRCQEKGGHLAYITSREELESILTEANKTDLRFLWVGGRTTISGNTVQAAWLDGTPLTYINENDLWYPGEPSGRDMTADDHVIEPYVMLWKIKDVWSFNDNSNVCLKEYKSYRIGYICEVDEEVYR
ncbi:MAG: hypothetical protein K5695_17000 [Oscillospiraceae bacterium]|nr:hypothetical protein [Oscillospiraceae bacterium]